MPCSLEMMFCDELSGGIDVVLLVSFAAGFVDLFIEAAHVEGDVALVVFFFSGHGWGHSKK